MSVGKEFDMEVDALLKKRDNVAKAFSLELHNAVVEATPVDTGDLKKAWHWSQEAVGHYQSSNNMEHATVIDGGRRDVNGVMKGSEQLPDGFQPLVDKEEDTLQTMLKAIR